MALVRCERGHYYDDAKNDSCPSCRKPGGEGDFTADDVLREQLTVSLLSDEGRETELYGEAVSEGDKTIGIFSPEAGNWCTVGWLVCVSGPVKGKSYTLHSGRNFAGRDPDMDIALSDDLTLSREKHFSIVYDPKENAFYIIAGAGRTYINDRHLEGDSALADGDRITAGESEYIFVPFCKEGRTWG
jgi:hypothetical protein